MIPNSSLIVSPTEPQGRNRKKVWFRKGKQLFNKDNANILLGFSSVDPKTFIANNSVKSIVINCSSKTTYTVSKIKSARFNVASYDKEIAPGVASTNIVENNNETKLTITTGDKDKYLCVYYYNSANDTLTEAEIRNSIQIEAGTIATPYEAYVENKMFVKNSNDVYEEFIKKQEEIYSTNEKNIGKWIDGRALYRKVVDCGTMPNATSKTISTGLSNVSYKKMEGMITNGTLYYEMNNTRPTDTNTINTIGLYINNNYIIIESKIDRSSYTGHVILEYTKNN